MNQLAKDYITGCFNGLRSYVLEQMDEPGPITYKYGTIRRLFNNYKDIMPKELYKEFMPQLRSGEFMKAKDYFRLQDSIRDFNPDKVPDDQLIKAIAKRWQELVDKADDYSEVCFLYKLMDGLEPKVGDELRRLKEEGQGPSD